MKEQPARGMYRVRRPWLYYWMSVRVGKSIRHGLFIRGIERPIYISRKIYGWLP
jgi:hypothetical protein